MNTIEGNKLIAEFDGCWLKYPNHDDKSSKYSLWLYPYNHIRHDAQNDTLDDMKYHSSWDWLMPVVEKIEAIENSDDYEVDIFGNCCQIGTLDENSAVGKTKIEAVWQAVIQFIEWYNSEQSVKESDTTKAT